MRGRGHCAQLRGVCFWRSNHALVGFSALLRESRGVSLLVFLALSLARAASCKYNTTPLKGVGVYIICSSCSFSFLHHFFHHFCSRL